MMLQKHRGGKDIGVHLMAGFQGTTLEEELKFLIRDFHVGGVVIFKRNVESPEQLRALLEEAQQCALEEMGRPLWVAVDQEGGPVQRLVPPFLQLPSASDLANQGPKAISQWSARAACELRKIGIHINLAPVLDVVPEGKPHFMAERSLGSDPRQVAQLGRIWVKTLQKKGISATGKHYPGLGGAALDPHHYAPVIRWENDEAMEKDLLPFRRVIRAGVRCIMTSHALYPTLDGNWPATLSPIINHEWLRNRLGFQGILFSDDMDMAAVCEHHSFEEMARQGMLASIDFFLFCQKTPNIQLFHQVLVGAVERDGNMADLHRRSLERMAHFGSLMAQCNGPAHEAVGLSSPLLQKGDIKGF